MSRFNYSQSLPIKASMMCPPDRQQDLQESYDEISPEFDVEFEMEFNADQVFLYFENYAAFRRFTKQVKNLLSDFPSNKFLSNAYSVELSEDSNRLINQEREVLGREADAFFEKLSHSGYAGQKRIVCEHECLKYMSAIGESHNDITPKLFILENVEFLRDNEYVFVVEDIEKAYQPLIDRAYAKNDVSLIEKIIPIALRSDFTDRKDSLNNERATLLMFEQLIKHQIPIIAGDSALSKVGDGDKENRLKLGNYVMFDNYAKSEHYGRPAIFFTGSSHILGSYGLDPILRQYFNSDMVSSVFIKKSQLKEGMDLNDVSLDKLSYDPDDSDEELGVDCVYRIRRPESTKTSAVILDTYSNPASITRT